MIELIFGTAFAVVLRILMGHLAEKYSTLESWLIYFTIFAIVVASITVCVILVRLVREILSAVRSGKERRGEKP